MAGLQLDVEEEDERGILGPRTVAEVFRWAEFAWLSLKGIGDVLFNTDFSVRLAASLRAGVVLSTDYSGMGGPEECFEMIAEQAQFEDDPKDLLRNITSQRSGDSERACREVLCERAGPLASSCVFGDIMDRCPPTRRLSWTSCYLTRSLKRPATIRVVRRKLTF